MPELPEVETICRALAASAVGKTIRRFRAFAPKLREPLCESDLNRRLKNCEIIAVRRRAKFILFDFNVPRTLLIHLGMTGSMRIESADSPVQLHDRAACFFSDNTALFYNDPRKFGLIKILENADAVENYFSAYAPEPLSADFCPSYLSEKIAKSSAPIKTQIMDQKIAVGVGNIYASESLFRAKISPARPAKNLTFAEISALVKTIKQVLKEAVRAGGTTINNYRQLDGNSGKFSRRLRVYGRVGESCDVCGEPIQKISQAGRSTFFCDHCQH